MMKIIIYLLLLTVVASLRGTTKNWTTYATNFKLTSKELKAKHETLLKKQVQNLVHLDSAPSIKQTLLLEVHSSTAVRQRNREFLGLGENPPFDDSTTSPEEIKRNIAKINVAKLSLSKMVAEVGESIKNAETQFKQDRLNKLNDLREQQILQASKEADSDLQMLVKLQARVKERRKAINNCLKMIYGGSNKFYWHMRDLLSRIKPQKACSVLKNTDLPKLSLAGYTEAIYKENNFVPPATDGSTITFFNTVKIPLFRCMCENVHVDGGSIAGKSTSMMTAEMKNDAETLAKKVENDFEEKEKLLTSQKGDVTLSPGVSAFALQQEAQKESAEEMNNEVSNNDINAAREEEEKKEQEKEKEETKKLDAFRGPGTSTALIGKIYTAPGVEPVPDPVPGAIVTSLLDLSKNEKHQNWSTYSTNFKNSVATKKKFTQRQTEQVHHLINLMNEPEGIVNINNVDPTLIKDDKEEEGEKKQDHNQGYYGETALLEKKEEPNEEAKEEVAKVDMTKMSSEEGAVLLNHVNQKVVESKSAIRNLQRLISEQEDAYRMEKMRAFQKEKENKLKEELQQQLRGQLNGAMAARKTLDKCLEALKVNGKPGKQWIKIRKLLAPTPPKERCIVFKSFQFPVLKAWNYDPKQPPSTMGAKLKAVILNCLCTKHPKTGHATQNMKQSDDIVNATTAYSQIASAASSQSTPSVPTTITTFLDIKEGPTTSDIVPPTATTPMNPEDMAKQLQKIESDKENVKKSMASIANKLEKEESTFTKERKFKKEKIKLTVMKRKSNAKALKMFEEISKMTVKRRLALVKTCMKTLLGSGQNVLYWELRKLFAKTPIEAQCSVLKAFKFPNLQLHGWNEKMVRSDVSPTNGEDRRLVAYRNLHVDEPPSDGSVITNYGDAVKISLFRCMCEEKTVDKITKEEENDEGNGNLGENGEQNTMKQPILKNKKEESEVEDIDKEEAKVDAEEEELKNDPALKDLINP